MADQRDAIERADATGGVLVPAVVALGYGSYLLIAVDEHSTNGLLLAALGFLSLSSVMLAARWRAATWIPSLLGLYTFGVLGCMALGLAVSERSSWSVIVAAVFWLVFGWYALSRAVRFRRTTRV